MFCGDCKTNLGTHDVKGSMFDESLQLKLFLSWMAFVYFYALQNFNCDYRYFARRYFKRQGRDAISKNIGMGAFQCDLFLKFPLRRQNSGFYLSACT